MLVPAGNGTPPPRISKEEQAAKGKPAGEPAPKYRTEMLMHP